ncbi:hypothetical protein ABPG75_011948 [Micractinium tetrahymenae]
MESELRTITSLIAMLPDGGGPGAPSRFRQACTTVGRRLYSLAWEHEQSRSGAQALTSLLRSLAAHGEAAAALGGRIASAAAAAAAAGSSIPPAQQEPIMLSLSGLTALSGDVARSLKALDHGQAQQQRQGTRRKGPRLVPAAQQSLLQWAAAALPALTRGLLAPLRKADAVELLENASTFAFALGRLIDVQHANGTSSPAAPLRGLCAELASLLHILVSHACELEQPGDEGFHLLLWASILTTTGNLLTGSSPELKEAVVAALAGDGGADSGLRRRFAAALLRLLAGLAQRALLVQSLDMPHRAQAAVCCDRAVCILLSNTMQQPAKDLLAQQSVHGPLLRHSVALLRGLQLAVTDASQPAAQRRAAGGDLLRLAASAAAAIGMVLFTHEQACAALAPSADADVAGMPAGRQGGLFQQRSAAATAAWQAVGTLPAAAAVLRATSGQARSEAMLGTCLDRFDMLVRNIAGSKAAHSGQQQHLADSPDTLEWRLLGILSCSEELAEAAAEQGGKRADRLLLCIRLLRAEGAARLLPVTGPEMLRWWRENLSRTVTRLAQQEGEEAAASEAALAAARRCANMGCTNLAGASDAELPTKRCSRCLLLRYCSPACQAADWQRHRACCQPAKA